MTADLKKVLIVEDDFLLLEILSKKFIKSGFDVNIAINGEECMKVLKSRKPDIIILDIVMPVMDGFEVLQQMRSLAELSSIPVIVLSNLGREEDVQKAKSMGAKDFLVKSNFTTQEIVDKVSNMLKSKT
ncbi:MAG: response regulator [Patescibacteria group bacterium]